MSLCQIKNYPFSTFLIKYQSIIPFYYTYSPTFYTNYFRALFFTTSLAGNVLSIYLACSLDTPPHRFTRYSLVRHLIIDKGCGLINVYLMRRTLFFLLYYVECSIPPFYYAGRCHYILYSWAFLFFHILDLFLLFLNKKH